MSETSLNKWVSSWKAGGDSQGVVALKALEYCQADNLPPPEWVIRDIVDCWRHFCEGSPVTGWVGDIEDDLSKGNIPLTLDDAFGVPLQSKPSAKLNAQVTWYGAQIAEYLEQNKLPKSPISFDLAGKELGISEAQAQKWFYKYQELKAINR